MDIVRRALPSPLRQIAANAGIEGAIVLQKVLELSRNHGFDAEPLQYVEMLQAGLLDPAKVVRCALENAASIATLMLTTDAIISEIPEKEEKK